MKKVLVINRDPDFQRLVKKYLERNGFVATVINDDEAVLKKVDEYSPDLVLLDIQVERDLLLCRQLEEKRKVANLKLVLLTDQNLPENIDCSP